MTYALFIDDERHPPQDGRVWAIATHWMAVKTIIEAMGSPNHISFDHDLGEGVPYTGYDIVKELVKMDMNGEIELPRSYYVHSQNPVGRDNINAYLMGYFTAKDRIDQVPPGRTLIDDISDEEWLSDEGDDWNINAGWKND